MQRHQQCTKIPCLAWPGQLTDSPLGPSFTWAGHWLCSTRERALVWQHCRVLPPRSNALSVALLSSNTWPLHLTETFPLAHSQNPWADHRLSRTRQRALGWQHRRVLPPRPDVLPVWPAWRCRAGHLPVRYSFRVCRGLGACPAG